MLEFEWDEEKNRSNKKKHSISFNNAKETFQDDNAVEFLGKSQPELRIVRIGKTLGKILITVVYTMRKAVIRIISARQASTKEIKTYIENSLIKQADDEDKD
ncbi:MAG: BrnT family toxin [Saprospiraceae bacterium]|nr:BrnT family toxin [Saprospiraceae bacterium]